MRLAIHLAWLVVRHCEACGRGGWVVCGCSGERRRKKKDEGKQAGSQKMAKRCHSRKERWSRCHVLGSSVSRAVKRRMALREAFGRWRNEKLWPRWQNGDSWYSALFINVLFGLVCKTSTLADQHRIQSSRQSDFVTTRVTSAVIFEERVFIF